MAASASDERVLIETHFHQGYEYKVIRDFLEIRNEIVMSRSTLKRRLREYGSARSEVTNFDDNTLRNVIHLEVSGPGRGEGAEANVSHTCISSKSC